MSIYTLNISNIKYNKLFGLDPTPNKKKKLIIKYIDFNDKEINQIYNENETVYLVNIKKIILAEYFSEFKRINVLNTINKLLDVQKTIFKSEYVICVFTSKIDLTSNKSSVMRGYQLWKGLEKLYKKCYLNPKYNFINNNHKNDKIIIICIKQSFPTEKFYNFKNKLIIWDMIDSFTNLKKINKYQQFLKIYRKCDLINCPNKNIKFIMSKKNDDNSKIVFIPHNWDIRSLPLVNKSCLNESLTYPRFGFLGTPSDSNERYLLNNLKRIDYIGNIPGQSIIGKYNVLCIFRSEYMSFARPSTKTYVAASLNCIVVTRLDDYGSVDLLGKDYPYYIKVNNGKSEIVNINEALDLVIKTFKTDIWYKALNTIKKVKTLTSINNISLQFKNLIENSI
jgi:hypothetical protein